MDQASSQRRGIKRARTADSTEGEGRSSEGVPTGGRRARTADSTEGEGRSSEGVPTGMMSLINQ